MLRTTLLTILAILPLHSQHQITLGGNNLPPEVQAQLQAQAAQRGASLSQNSTPKGSPDQVRQQLLQKLTIDRTNAGILQARLDLAKLEDEIKNPPKVDPPKINPPKNPPPAANPQDPNKPADPNKPTPPKQPDPAQAAEAKKAAQEVERFRLDLTLGHWDKAAKFLGDLKEPLAKSTYARILQQLAQPVKVQPRPEVAAVGARPHTQQHYLRATDVLALANLSPAEPDDATLSQLSNLLRGCKNPPANFFETLANTSRYFGKKDPKTTLRTARLLLDAAYLDEAKPYLPDRATAEKENDHSALNLLARWHAESHKKDAKKKEHLPLAWDISLSLVGNKKAPFSERAEALYRALALVPSLEGETGKEWLHKTFSNSSGEGFEILAAVGTLTAQVRQAQMAPVRLEQIKLQHAAAQALLTTPDLDPKPWAETLTLYARNWLHEANHTNRYDTSTSTRPDQQRDPFGNIYYSPYNYYQQQAQSRNSRIPQAIRTGDILENGIDEKWLSLIDEPVRLEVLAIATKLYLKVKENEKAFPLLKQLAAVKPDQAKDLAKEIIQVWAENHNPNQQNRYRSSYYYFYGYNQRAETIPLTRSKQERNLRELAKLITDIKALKLDENFNEEFADAFIQCHSQAEVWRVETLRAIFGDLEKIDPETAASLIRRMRANLAGLWPNPKVQEQAKTKRKDKELHLMILQGYTSAINFCEGILRNNPDDAPMQVQLASLAYEQSNYLSSLASNPEHSAIKRANLDNLAAATQTYIKTLPLEDEDDESVETFTTWFYAALGSPNLAALKNHHQPVPSEYKKIKAALASVPEECRERHMDKFAKELNTRLANVSPDLKYRFLEAALPITGEHKQIEDAVKIYQYYQDLITEIQLDVYLDGPDQIDATQPFGLFVNLRHTREIERESGGFQRYLINQNNSPYSYNYGRPTEDYRDKFEKAARAAPRRTF